MVGRYSVAVVGSGFAGTILARVLRSAGLRVALLEKTHHPRFAIGESSTPLAALALERLARRYGLKDLGWLASYGRWLEHLPQLRRGLKRGFTFYHHRPGVELVASATNRDRLLVAASPDDGVADSHWLRSDVDAFLVDRAVTEGVDYLDRFEIEVRRSVDGWRIGGSRQGEEIELTAEILIDATGPAAVSRQAIPNPSRVDDLDLDTLLVYGHFADLGEPPELGVGPYPDERAAVHHLLEEGWMYVLPFDHGVVSAGLALRRPADGGQTRGGVPSATERWQRVIERYPTLARRFERARPVQHLRSVTRMQRLLTRAAGRDWALMPHTFAFLDPMFSMGIAWSLLGVERLADVLLGSSRSGGFDMRAVATGLERYRRLLDDEVGQMAALLDAAWLAMGDFDLFTAASFLYFAVVSFSEVEQRLQSDGRAAPRLAWRGFLGADDPDHRRLFAEARKRLSALDPADWNSARTTDFAEWIRRRIARWNIAGLADPARSNLYPVDLDLLLDRAGLLGMQRSELETKVPLLRGTDLPL